MGNVYASDAERMRALVHALECGQWSRAFELAETLSGLCDRSGVLSEYTEVRPLLDSVGRLVQLLGHAATAAHRADVAEAALVQLLEGLGQDDAPRARAIAAARSAATLLEVARGKAPEALEARALEAVGRGIGLARTLEARAENVCPECGNVGASYALGDRGAVYSWECLNRACGRVWTRDADG